MKLMRIVGVCLVAAAALSAVAVSTASAAAPEIGRCLKVAKGVTGKFATANCTTAGTPEKHGFEWTPGFVKGHFTTKSTSAATLETVTKTTVTCKTETSGGEYTGLKNVGGVVVKFNECTSAGLACSTKGSKTGELVTNVLEGVIGFENKLKKKIGFDLFPKGHTGRFIEFVCAGLQVSVEGSVIVPIVADKMALTQTLKYKAEKGKQKPEKLEGEPVDVLLTSLNGAKAIQSGQTITTVQTDEEKLEANAVV
jgi:hypothetical protein